MRLVRDEVVPPTRSEERIHMSDLLSTGRVELVLPASDAVARDVAVWAEELPGVAVAVQVARRAAQERPVLLPPELMRRAGRRARVLFVLVARLDHERGKEVGAVVVLQHLVVGRLVGVRGA